MSKPKKKKMIESLTDAQTVRFGEFVDKWCAIGLSTEPTNFEEAKKYTAMLYRKANLKEPTQFHLVDGPLTAIDLIKKLDPSKSKNDIFNEMAYGSHDASWISFYDYFAEVVGIDFEGSLEGVVGLAKNCGWVSFYEDVVVFQHRPEVIKFDDQKRLHCEDGPAIRYRDGTAVYSWHGTSIPKDWIENKATALTPAIAISWTNIEQRRCACEILGWATILRSLDSKVIDQDNDPQIGTLLEVNIPDIGKEKFLQVICGTGRTFAIPVPPEMKTALDANAWTFGIEPDFLRQLEVRT